MKQCKIAFLLNSYLELYIGDIFSRPGWRAKRDVVLPLIGSWMGVCFPRVPRKSSVPGRGDVPESAWELRYLDKERMYKEMISSLGVAIEMLKGR